jgi:hypothetical protein
MTSLTHQKSGSLLLLKFGLCMIIMIYEPINGASFFNVSDTRPIQAGPPIAEFQS